MREEEKTFEVTVRYRVFDVGEKVKPIPNKSGLPPGIYTVRDYHPPLFISGDDQAFVFVEGYEYGIESWYLTAADDSLEDSPCDRKS